MTSNPCYFFNWHVQKSDKTYKSTYLSELFSKVFGRLGPLTDIMEWLYNNETPQKIKKKGEKKHLLVKPKKIRPPVYKIFAKPS